MLVHYWDYLKQHGWRLIPKDHPNQMALSGALVKTMSAISFNVRTGKPWLRPYPGDQQDAV